MTKPLSKAVSLIALSSVLFAGATYFVTSTQTDAAILEPALHEQTLAQSYGPSTFAQALKASERDLLLAKQRTERAPGQWLSHSSLAMNHLVRAQLTGEFDALLLADRSLGASIELAPAGSPPAVEASTINLSLHRYPSALSFIETYEGFAARFDPAERAEMRGQRGEVAFYSGDYALAKDHFEAAYSQSETPNNIFRLANWHKYAGSFDQAIALYAKGAKDPRFATPQMLSTYHLQIGALELQRGNWEEAEAYFQKADALFPGHWLAQAHVAQMLAVRGKFIRAEALYSDIIERHANPDVMMALADLKEFQGQDALASDLRKRAAMIFDERLDQLPEAYFDHALDLALSSGANARALELARANFDTRPYGDAEMALARSLSASGDPERAMEILRDVEASGWKSVELYLDLAEASRLLGDESAAKRYEETALQMNPRALDPRADLLAFGSH